MIIFNTDFKTGDKCRFKIFMYYFIIAGLISKYFYKILCKYNDSCTSHLYLFNTVKEAILNSPLPRKY